MSLPPLIQIARRSVDAAAALWRPVLLPTIGLWVLATYLAGALLRSYDVTEYSMYAHAVLRHPLFHALPREYPAPAVLVFLVPLLLPFSYPWAFAVPVGVVLVALAVSAWRIQDESGGTETLQRMLVYLALGAVMFLTARYDIFAAATLFWAVRAASRGRWSSAWTWSALGASIKLFPAILWPALLVAEYRQTGSFPWKRGVWMVGTAALVIGIPAVFDPSATLAVLHYYSRRPPEIGSLAAGLSLVLDPGGWHHVLSFHSFNAVSPLAAPIADTFGLLGAGGCLVVWWLQWRGRLPVEAVALTTVSLAVLGSKVVSVQYLLWLVPLWSLYRLRVSWVLACFVNSIVFPYSATTGLTHFLSDHAVTFLTLLYSFRDVLIAVGTVAWFREARRRNAARVPSPDLVTGPT